MGLLECDIVDFDKGRSIEVEHVHFTYMLLCVLRPKPLSQPLMRVKKPRSSFLHSAMKRHDIWIISL